MTIWIRLAAVLVLGFAPACGGAPAAKKAAEAPAPNPTKKTPAELRADELIADLKKREEAIAQIKTKPIVEYTPKSKPTPGSTYPSATYSPSSSSPSGANENDANFWRQEFSMAQARLQSATQQLESARQRANDAQRSTSGGNQAVGRMNQDAISRAQQEVSSAQSAVNEAQRAVDYARQNALNAGVSPTYLR